MNDSMAQPRSGIVPLELSGWKTALNWGAAMLLFLLFVSSGVWKITAPQAWAMRIAELKFPASLSMAAALVFGIAETVAAVMVLVPRLRRWGAILTGVLLLGFIGYFALNYNVLRGAECSCFPWIKRVVGPEFFIGDGVLLLLAFLAGIWAKPAESFRTAVVIAATVTVFALVSYGAEAVRQSGTRAPRSVAVNGAPYSIQHGKVFSVFLQSAVHALLRCRQRDVEISVGRNAKWCSVPVEQPQYADQFLQDTGLKALVTTDFATLAPTFGYSAYPFGVAIENGREKAPLTQFEQAEPAATLKKLGFIQ